MTMGSITSGSGGELSALLRAMNNPEEVERIEAIKSNAEQAQRDAQEALRALEDKETELSNRESELERGLLVLNEERSQLEEDQANHKTLEDDLQARLEDMRATSADLDARRSSLESAEADVKARELALEGMEAKATEALKQAEAMREMMRRRVEAVNEAWGP